MSLLGRLQTWHCEHLHTGHAWRFEREGAPANGWSFYHRCRRCGLTTPKARLFVSSLHCVTHFAGGAGLPGDPGNAQVVVDVLVDAPASFDPAEAPELYLRAYQRLRSEKPCSGAL